MIYAENQTHRKLVRWLDRQMAELRPVQVEVLAWWHRHRGRVQNGLINLSK